LSDDNHDESHRRSNKKHDDEDRYLKSKQRKLKEKLRKMEAEDGEILEDGELEEADEAGSKKQDIITDPRKIERENSGNFNHVVWQEVSVLASSVGRSWVRALIG
jgi:hypothetical protein